MHEITFQGLYCSTDSISFRLLLTSSEAADPQEPDEMERERKILLLHDIMVLQYRSFTCYTRCTEYYNSAYFVVNCQVRL